MLYQNTSSAGTYIRTTYGYQNDMSNTTWVDASPYALPVDTGSEMLIEDDEGGHTWGAVNDTGLSLDLAFYPLLELWQDEGTADINWDSWGVRLLWANGSSYYIWYQEPNSYGGHFEYNVLSLCDNNTVINDIEIVCWGDDLGDNLMFDYLNIYADTGWYTQDVELVLTGEIFLGMLLSAISLAGLAMIPIGTFVGAVLIKNKKLNEETWLIPLVIVLLGFALFIGGLA